MDNDRASRHSRASRVLSSISHHSPWSSSESWYDDSPSPPGTPDVAVPPVAWPLRSEIVAASASYATPVASHRASMVGGPAANFSRLPPSRHSVAVSVVERPLPAVPRTKLTTALIMAALCLAVFLAALDTVIVTTALPAMAQDVGASDAGMAWLGAGYLLANAASVPLWAKVSDIFGRKPILILANAIFMAGSLVAAVAANLTVLIAGRVLQGLGGGGLIILVNICISDMFSLRQRGMYFGLVGAMWAVSSAIGPPIGGAFAETIGWRWCFWINLPCDGISLVVIFFFLKIEIPKTPIWEGLKAIDWLGGITVAGATLMLLMGLQFGGATMPWTSAQVVCLILFGFITFALFFLTQWRFSRYPVIPLRIFRTRSNVACLVVCFMHAMTFIAVAYFLPVYFQSVLGASPAASGVWLLPLALPLAFATAFTGVYIRKTGRYLELILGGLAVLTLGAGLLINLPPYQSWPRSICYQIIVAIGIGPLFQAPLVALQTQLLPTDVGTGTSTFGFTRMLGQGIGVVLGQVILHSGLQKAGPDLLAAGLPPDLVALVAAGSFVEAAPRLQRLTEPQVAAVRNATTASFAPVWMFFTCVTFVGFMAALGIQRRELSEHHEEVKTGLKAEKAKAQAGITKSGLRISSPLPVQAESPKETV